MNTGCDIITTINLEVLPISDPSCIVGINDLSISEIKIYPIPARDVFFVEGESEIDAISIYSMDYRKMKDVAVERNENKHQVSTENLNTGIYIVAIKTAGMIVYKKLIVE